MNETLSPERFVSQLEHPEREGEGVDLYHVTGWELPTFLDRGESFVLDPGAQHAQGEGVYFSEECPRFTAAEGSYAEDSPFPKAVIHIKGGIPSEGWYRSKAAFARRHDKPRTRHSNGKSVRLTVVDNEMINTEYGDIPMLHCTYEMM